MNRYKEDAKKQLMEVLENKKGNSNIIYKHKIELENIFNRIYIINVISNRIEFRDYFDSQYFKVVISCSIEAYSLFLDNYLRASALVLRSSLENFIKFIIEVNNKKEKKQYEINDRVYSSNKAKITEIIDEVFLSPVSNKLESLNGKMETEYKELSALSHSLTRESLDNVLNYFSELSEMKYEYSEQIVAKIESVTIYILEVIILLFRESFILWDSDELKLIIETSYKGRSVKRILNMIKD